METVEIITENGNHSDIVLSTDEWKEILLDQKLMNDKYKDVLLKFYRETDHKSTCKALGDKYDIPPSSIYQLILNFSNNLHSSIENGKEPDRIIPMTGKNIEGHVEWTLRPELVSAIEQTFLKTRYWVVKVTSDNWFDFAVKNNIWLGQYRYNIQDNSAVTNILNNIKLVNENDILFLGYKNKIHAYGKVLNTTSKSTDQISNIQNVINKNKHDFDSGIVKFNDSSIFYEELSDGCKNWGQRIAVEKWAVYCDESNVTTSGISDKINDGLVIQSLFGIDEDFALNLISSLENQYYEKHPSLLTMKKYTDLLKSNKNLIFTGAPGTGKTYLAKQIAEHFTTKKTSNSSDKILEADSFKEWLKSQERNGGKGISDSTLPQYNSATNFFIKKSGTLQAVYENIHDYKEKYKPKTENDLSGARSAVLSLIKEYGDLSKYSNNRAVSSKQNISFVQFHPSYDYTDFVEGLRPIQYEGIKEITFELKDGIFKSFCSDALIALNEDISNNIPKEERRNFVFIIDEINRGEISKIFGELFFSIDPGYRGEKGKVMTQYSNIQSDDTGTIFDSNLGLGWFYVPENVYIIGTMNDIDRSVESMDFAMRRRFAWKEINAVDRVSMWDGSIDNWKEEAKQRMLSLNKSIESIQGLSPAYHIGPAYFLKLRNYNGNFEKLWENHLNGVLLEYLRGFPNIQDELVKLKNAYDSPE